MPDRSFLIPLVCGPCTCKETLLQESWGQNAGHANEVNP